MAICVLQGSLLTLYEYLLIVLILVEVLLVIYIVASKKLICYISVVLDGWLLLIGISIVIIKSTSSCSSCVSHYCLQIHFDGAILLIILSLDLLSGQLLGMSFIIRQFIDNRLWLGNVICIEAIVHACVLACNSFSVVLVRRWLDSILFASIWVAVRAFVFVLLLFLDIVELVHLLV